MQWIDGIETNVFEVEEKMIEIEGNRAPESGLGCEDGN